MSSSSIYLDHAATTPADPSVVKAMTPYFTGRFANANSIHQPGREANVAVEEARQNIARFLNCEPAEIIFTSGGTESNNAAINGCLEAAPSREIITSAIEHHAVLTPAEQAESRGARVHYLAPDTNGEIRPEQVEEVISEQTALVSLMLVNNEIGSINPIQEISEICHAYGVPLHVDGVQAFGKIPVDVEELGVDLLSISGHKLYGPKGIGVLYVCNGTPWEAWMLGGSQERKRRGGTLNVPGIIGLSAAVDRARKQMDEEYGRIKGFRDTIISTLNEQLGERVQINGSEKRGIPHILNLTVTDTNGRPYDGEMLLLNLDISGVYLSSGSACTSGAIEPSHVLTGLGLSKEMAHSSIRVSMGKDNTVEQIHTFTDTLIEVLDRMNAGVLK